LPGAAVIFGLVGPEGGERAGVRVREEWIAGKNQVPVELGCELAKGRHGPVSIVKGGLGQAGWGATEERGGGLRRIFRIWDLGKKKP